MEVILEPTSEQAAKELLAQALAKVPQIMALALLKNTTTDKAIFIDFSGHVNKLYVDVRKSKEEYLQKIYYIEIKTVIETIIKEETYLRAQKSLEKMDKCIEFLNNLK